MKHLSTTFAVLVACTACAQPGNWEWALATGGVSNNFAYDMAADAAGNTYAVGEYTNDTIVFGEHVLLNSGGPNMYIVKFDAGGNVLWAKGESGSALSGRGIALDGAGYIYVTGNCIGTELVIGSTTLSSYGDADVFIAKYDTAGNFVWAAHGGSELEDFAWSIDVDALGNGVVGGRFKGATMTVGGNVLANTYTAPNEQLYMARFNAAGLWTSALQDGGPSADNYCAVAIDDEQNTYWVGNILVGNTTAVKTYKFDASGAEVWSHSATSTGHCRGYAVDVDVSGNVLVAGEFRCAGIDFSGQVLTNTMPAGLNQDIFLVKYDSDGDLLWATSEGEAPSGDVAHALEISADGRILISGHFSSTAFLFGTTLLASQGVSDLFIAEYDQAGNVLWASSGGGPYQELNHGMAVDGMGNVYTCGTTTSPTLHFAPLEITSVMPTNTNALMAKLGTTTGVDDQLAGIFEIRPFPNPSSSAFRLTLRKPAETITVRDIHGRTVLSRSARSGTEMTLDLSGHPAGIYCLQVIGEDGLNGTSVVVLVN